MKNSIIALFAVFVSLALLSGCCCSIPTGIPGLNESGLGGFGGEAKPAPIQAIETLDEAKDVLKASLENKEITDFEVFASPDEVVVEYFDVKEMYETDERAQLAFVLAATAVAYSYPETITAHRYIDKTPKRKASAKTEDVLSMVAGNTTFSKFVYETMSYSELSESDAIMPKLVKETLEQTQENFGE
ncbi:hypothetical protein HY992_05970 [Candidatus Micrarchaeota archaeon]|nr:hypothetical protein [Candidatus Micrarchaeota archaeon]